MIRHSGTPNLNTNPFSPQNTANGKEHRDLIQEAIVVDVIVNDSHPLYAADGYNVGAIQFRSLTGDSYKDQEQLNWALPIETNVTDYPLLNEIVQIHVTLNRKYYSRKINISSRVTSHAVFGLNTELSEVVTAKQQMKTIKSSQNTPRRDKGQPTDKLGKYFTDQPHINRLRSDEGDIIHEGRSGHSIRFGAAWKAGTTFPSLSTDQAPNLIMRIGPDRTQSPSVTGKFGLVREDINKDASSIWMVSDQIVPLEFSTTKTSAHGKSIVDFPSRLVGNQIVINTDRFVLNTKLDKIMGFSGKGIHWTTIGDFTVDATRDYLSSVGRTFVMDAKTKASIVAPRVYVGLLEGQDEPIPAGATLAKFISDFLQIFIDNATAGILPTGTPGSPSPFNPKVIVALKKLQLDANKGAKASFNSSIAFTKK